MYSRQERWLNTIYKHCLRRKAGIRWRCLQQWRCSTSGNAQHVRHAEPEDSEMDRPCKPNEWRTFFNENLPLVPDLQEDHISETRTSWNGIWSLATLNDQAGRQWPSIAAVGDLQSSRAFRSVKRKKKNDGRMEEIIDAKTLFISFDAARPWLHMQHLQQSLPLKCRTLQSQSPMALNNIHLTIARSDFDLGLYPFRGFKYFEVLAFVISFLFLCPRGRRILFLSSLSFYHSVIL